MKTRAKDATEYPEISEQTGETETQDLFEMANLYPDTTGLPMTVWISPRANVKHDVLVKVNTTHGSRMDITNTAVVGVRPAPRVITGQLSADDRQALFEWVRLNQDALVAYWEGRIDTARVIHALKPLAPAP